MPTTDHPLALKNEAYTSWIEENMKSLKELWDDMNWIEQNREACGEFHIFCETQFDNRDDCNYPAPL